jgi:hypothetical protein
VLRDKCDTLSHKLHEAQEQRDLAMAELAHTQQELNQQRIGAQNKTEVLVQDAAREQKDRDKQWHARCEKIKSEYEERLRNKLRVVNEDWNRQCAATSEEWSTKLKHDLEEANAEWRTRLTMRERELKEHYQKEMGHIEAGRARIEEERKQLEQEVIAARETIRLHNDTKEVEISRRIALEDQLEDARTRERIQPELMGAFLLVDAVVRQTARARSPQHPSEISTPLSLTDISKNLSTEEEVLDSAFAHDAKRRKLS